MQNRKANHLIREEITYDPLLIQWNQYSGIWN